MSEKVQDNKKIILWAACAVVAVAVLVLGYIYLVRQPGQAKANDNIGEADIQMILGNDSIALAEYMRNKVTSTKKQNYIALSLPTIHSSLTTTELI